MDSLTQYWFPFALAVVLYSLTGWGKRHLWSREGKLWTLGRKSLPFHAPVLGAAVGLVPSAPWPVAVHGWGWLAGAAVGAGCAYLVGAVRHALGR